MSTHILPLNLPLNPLSLLSVMQSTLTSLLLSTLKITATTLLLSLLIIIINTIGRTLGTPLGYLIDDILTDEEREPAQREADAKCAGSIIGFLLWVSASVFEGLKVWVEQSAVSGRGLGVVLAMVVGKGAWDAVVMVAVLGCVVRGWPEVRRVVESRTAALRSAVKLL
ncbi:hypothetical protein MBLNU457_1180t1 [Dothideomycetes sp. NU457]